MNKVYAQVDINPTLFPPAGPFSSLSALINILVPNLMLIAGIIFFILAVVSGFTIIKTAGSGDAQALEKGKKAITFALIGFVLIFGSFFIIQMIEFLTGIKILSPEF